MKPDLHRYLGQCVTVRVDRPLGSRHPRHPDLMYPVNYGELPGTVSGDGQPIDAYLLGWSVPLREARGVVVAVLERADDAEDKLVVVRRGFWPADEAILQATRFQERFFCTRLRAVLRITLCGETHSTELHSPSCSLFCTRCLGQNGTCIGPDRCLGQNSAHEDA